jgi:hypothetical protein
MRSTALPFADVLRNRDFTLAEFLSRPLAPNRGWRHKNHRCHWVAPLHIFVLAASIASAAAASAQEQQKRFDLGFYSVLLPTGEQWKQQSSPGFDAVFGRDITRKERRQLAIDKYHTFILIAKSVLVSDLPYESSEKLRAVLAEQIKQEYLPGELVSLSVSPDTANYSEESTFCINYIVKGNQEDRVSGQLRKSFVLTFKGKRCLHLTFPLVLIDLSYSQRSYSGKWLDAFDKEVEAFFATKFSPSPPQLLDGYIAEHLKTYASALISANRPAEAENIKKHAEILEQPTTGTSRYLGFVPSDDLRAYAQFLRSRNNAAEADRMEILAEKYAYDQTMHIIALQKQLSEQAPVVHEP